MIEEESRGEPVAAEERARRVLAERLDAARAARDVDEEDAPAITFHAGTLYAPNASGALR